MRTYRFLFILSFFFSFISCNDGGIKSKWKYMDGYHFGDFLDFGGKNFQIKNDTLYNGEIPFAIVEDFKRSFIPGTENKLTLKNIKTGEIGLYTDKGK